MYAAPAAGGFNGLVLHRSLSFSHVCCFHPVRSITLVWQLSEMEEGILAVETLIDLLAPQTC